MWSSLHNNKFHISKVLVTQMNVCESSLLNNFSLKKE